MMEIEDAQRPPLDQLAADFFRAQRSGHPPISFCQQVLGVPEDDQAIARRLSVSVSTVRGWREIGKRASSRWACR